MSTPQLHHPTVIHPIAIHAIAIHAIAIHAIVIHAVVYNTVIASIVHPIIHVILETLHRHAAHDLVGEVPHDHKQNSMDGDHSVLVAPLGQSHQDAGC